MIFKKTTAVIFGCLLLAGCSAKKNVKQTYLSLSAVAVLPFNNYTTDMDGPAMARYWFDKRIHEKKGYNTLPLADVDSKLKEMGITDGGQLGSATPQKLGETLNADALIYGDLLEFAYQTTGFLNVRKVRAKFKMVDAKTGNVLWENEGKGSTSKTSFSSSDAIKSGIKALGGKVLESITKNPLKQETLEMVGNAVKTLPRSQ